METKFDWSKIDKQKFAKELAVAILKFEKEKHEKFKAYWKYQIFTPLHVKLWHKMTFKKTPQL